MLGGDFLHFMRKEFDHAIHCLANVNREGHRGVQILAFGHPRSGKIVGLAYVRYVNKIALQPHAAGQAFPNAELSRSCNSPKIYCWTRLSIEFGAFQGHLKLVYDPERANIPPQAIGQKT